MPKLHPTEFLNQSSKDNAHALEGNCTEGNHPPRLMTKNDDDGTIPMMTIDGGSVVLVGRDGRSHALGR